eukprot:c883_g1_i2.p2 GENE.c883_g1_i2~~c883_g1_i2.p2  ORF type:complete len:109 (-),score=13.79 c883_g1_i2:10-336(-)
MALELGDLESGQIDHQRGKGSGLRIGYREHRKIAPGLKKVLSIVAERNNIGDGAGGDVDAVQLVRAGVKAKDIVRAGTLRSRQRGQGQDGREQGRNRRHSQSCWHCLR